MEAQAVIESSEPTQADPPELRRQLAELDVELDKIRSERREAEKEMESISDILMSDPNRSPSEIIETNRRLRKRMDKLSSSLAIIDAPKKALELQRAKIEAQLFEFERARAIEAHSAGQVRLYKLVLELNGKVETANALIRQITELSRVKLDERYRAGVQPGRILKSPIGAQNFIPDEIKPIKISNEDMLKEAMQLS